MKRYRGFLVLLLGFALLCCAGCGKTKSESSGKQGDSQGQEDSREDREEPREAGTFLSAAQWKNGFLRKDSPGWEEETPYYEIQRSGLESPDLKLEAEELREASSYAWNGRYLLTSVKTRGEEHFFLSRQKEDLKWKKAVEILTDWEERPKGYVLCLDVIDEETIAVLYVEKSSGWDGKTTGYDLLLLNQKGMLQSVHSVTEGYQEAGIPEEMLTPGHWWCDQSGYQYILPERTRLVVLDSEGSVKLERTCDEETGETVAAAFHMPDGSPVFSLGSMNSGSRLIRLEFPGGEEKVLWEDTSAWLRQFTVTPEGVLYYTRGNNLVAWDLTDGHEKRLFSLDALELDPNDLFHGEQTLWVAAAEKGTLLFYDLEGQKVSVLKDTLPEDEDSLTFALVDTSSSFVKACASLFSGEYGGKMIRCKAYPGLWAEAWTRFSAEIAAKNVPDLMVIDHAQMLTLVEKGVLTPLEDLMAEDSPEKLLSGLREAGTVDGALYGIAAEQMLWGMIVSDELWPGEAWTAEDILEICDRGEPEGIFCGEGPDFTLWILTGALTGDVPYYDTESGESRFESPEFIRLLEACKKYGNGEKASGNVRELLEEGRYLASVEWYPDINSFVNKWMRYGEGFHFVGFPEQKDHIGVYNSTCFVAVARDPKDGKEIGAFLDYLLLDETQSRNQLGYATRSALENLFWYSEYNDELHCMYHQQGKTRELPMKADGTSYVTDYLELADRSEIMVYNDDPVWSIVSEEAAYFWNGSRSAEDTARVIDNRVQLYLNEQK